MSKYESLIRKIISNEGREGKINLSFVDEKTVHKLNKKYRGLDKPTDVLSFNMDEDGVIGDVLISISVARKNAKRYGVACQAEIKRLVIHGTLHLLGYDHGKEMRNAEKTYQKL